MRFFYFLSLTIYSVILHSSSLYELKYVCNHYQEHTSLVLWNWNVYSIAISNCVICSNSFFLLVAMSLDSHCNASKYMSGRCGGTTRVAVLIGGKFSTLFIFSKFIICAAMLAYFPFQFVVSDEILGYICYKVILFFAVLWKIVIINMCVYCF